MYLGLTLSLAAHVALLTWALVSFQTTPPLKVNEPEAVEVALISPDDLVRLTKGDRSSKKLETRASKQTEKAPVSKKAKRAVVKTIQPPAASAPPPADSPDEIAKKLASLAPPEPMGPTPEELAAKKAAEAKAKAKAELALQKAEEAKKKAEAAKRKAKAEQEKKRRQAEEAEKRKLEAKRRKEAERKKRLAAKLKRERKRKLAEKRRRERERKAKKFDTGKISALLNKIPDAKAPAAGSDNPNARTDAPRGAQAGAPEGRDDRLTASQLSLLGVMMKRKVSQCWNINSGLEGVDRIVIDIELRLRRDGRLDGRPRVVSRGSGPLFQDAANNAMRALVQCEPYDLPEQFYEGGWDHMVVTFDPQKMF